MLVQPLQNWYKGQLTYFSARAADSVKKTGQLTHIGTTATDSVKKNFLNQLTLMLVQLLQI